MIDFEQMQSDIKSQTNTINQLNDSLKMLLGSDGYMSLVKASEYLDVSQSTLRRYLSEIPHFQRDRLILIKKSDLDAWIARYKK